jgi:diguanylate cyclase (GGDEF)-like protein
MAAFPRDTLEEAPADTQRCDFGETLGRLLGALVGLVERCGWRNATMACSLAMLLVTLCVIATLDATLDDVVGPRSMQFLMAAAVTWLLAGPCLAVAFKLVHHLAHARTRLMVEVDRRIIAEQQLRRLATTDELTGLSNRRHFIERAREAIDMARRYGQWCSFAVIDVDRFKDINDQRGHLAGDDALVTLSTVLKANLRAADLAARLGGDEFVVLMPITDPEAANAAAERIRRAVREDGGSLGLSVSIGVASIEGAKASLEELMTRADTALYAAKRSGRNRVITGEPAASRARPRAGHLSIAS